MKEYIIAGNWKMFKKVDESAAFIRQLEEKLKEAGRFPFDKVEVLVYPTFTALYPVKDLGPGIKKGAQDMHFEEDGAFTGAISPSMLEGLVQYVLVGHSERRQLFHETDEGCNKRIKTALAHGFTPMLCIGESLEEREAEKTFSRLTEQLNSGLEGLTPEEVDRLTVAYEPIWAIGTGKTASPEQAQEVHAFIRGFLKEKTDGPEAMKILYGGSVKPANSYELLSQKDINGVLVGGASLKVDSFFGIIENSLRLVD